MILMYNRWFNYPCADVVNTKNFQFYYVTSLIDTEKDIWIFGASFLLNYISIFDYDNKSISFYSKTPLLNSTDIPIIKDYIKYQEGILFYKVTFIILFVLNCLLFISKKCK